MSRKGKTTSARDGENRRMKTPMERFTEKYKVNTGCWIWHGCILKGGYGQIQWEGRRQYAHRVSYQIFKGEIFEGLFLDHLCRNRACVNPEHLEPVTPRENLLRGMTKAAENAKKTHCPEGHEYRIENTYIRKTRDRGRGCKTCRVAATRRWRARNKQPV